VYILEIFPAFEIGLLNGWIFMLVFFLLYGIFLKTCSKEVVNRLYDNERWTKSQSTYTKLGKIFGFIHIIFLIFTPVNILSIEFMIGFIIYLIGTIGFFIAVIEFKKAPLGKPINLGLYKISRNPQILALLLVSLGTSFIIGSWTAVIVAFISTVFFHFRILGEEKRLTEQYGDSYLDYKKKVARYFYFF